MLIRGREKEKLEVKSFLIRCSNPGKYGPKDWQLMPDTDRTEFWDGQMDKYHETTFMGLCACIDFASYFSFGLETARLKGNSFSWRVRYY